MSTLDLNDFNYDLPKELIAQTAVTPRSYSKLLVVKGDNREHRRFYNIIDYLQKGDVIVINQTKVLKNKMVGQKSTGAKAEIIIMHAVDEYTVKARVKATKVRVGHTLEFGDLKGEIIDQENDTFFVKFNKHVNEIIDHAEFPNPPYIHRTVGDEYQTVYAKKGGSLAAPTSGLHFTPNLINTLKRKGVIFAYVTLHVGFGTFLPVRDDKVTGHKMEPEQYEIDEGNANIINNAKRLFVVGTTALKALESSARKTGKVEAKKEWSDFFIYPGVKLHLPIKGLITNFHLPKSTLILLISAFYGWDKIKPAYEEAVQKKYRFFSLGDASLFLK